MSTMVFYYPQKGKAIQLAFTTKESFHWHAKNPTNEKKCIQSDHKSFERNDIRTNPFVEKSAYASRVSLVYMHRISQILWLAMG